MLTHRFMLLAACTVALLPCAALARKTPQTSKSEPGAGTTTAEAGFGCAVAAGDLKPWEAKGLRVPATSNAQFKLWKSVTSLGDLSASAKSACHKLPPKTAFVNGPGAGTTTRADLVVAQAEVPVYRAYSKAPFHCGYATPAAEFGSWWSLTPPGPDKEAYRKATAVCNTWNDFSMVVKCKLKKGTMVAVGSTQSADCAEKPAGCTRFPTGWPLRYGSSPEHQVFINTYKRSQAELDQFLVGCQTHPY